MKRFSKNRWLRLLVVICALGVALAGCGSKEEKVAKFISKGDALLAKGDATRAILEYKNALQLDPKNTQAMLALGKAYLAKKEYRKAYSLFRSALEVDPSFDKAHLEVASLLSLARQGDKALKELASIKNPDKLQPRYSIIKARALVSLGRYNEALSAINSLGNIDRNRDALVILALCYRQLGDEAQLKATVSKWQQANPKDPGPYIFMAQYYTKQGKTDMAAQELASMVRADPGNNKLKIFRAQTLEKLGLIEEAKAAYKQLPEQPSMLKAQAAFWLRQKDFDQAKSLLRKVLKKDPKDVQAVILLAEVLASEGHVKEALSRLKNMSRKGLSKQDSERLDLAEARICVRTGEIEKAKQICTDVLRRNQGNMDAHFLLGRILLAQGQLDKAEVHLSQVAVARPNDDNAQILLARCQLLNKKDAVAGNTLKKALIAEPANKRLRLELVRYHVRRGEYDKAIRLLQKGVEISPNDLVLLKVKGEIEALSKKYEDAANDFQAIIKLAPHNPLGYMEMGRLMLAQKKTKDAVAWFKKAYNTKGGWQVAVPALIKTYAMAGKLDKAIKVAKNEVNKRSNSPLAHYYLGKTLLAKGDYSAAEKALTTASQLAPEWPEPYRALAQMYLKQGKIAKAIKRVEDIYSKRPSVGVGLSLASLYEYYGHYNKAIDVYKELLQKYKNSPVLLNNLAYLYTEHCTDKKKLNEAAEMITRALAIKPDAPNLLDTAAWVAYKQKRLNVAWNYIQDALAKGSQNAVIHLHAAIVARDLGKNDLAQKYLEEAIQQKLDQRVRDQAIELKKQWSS